MKLPFVSTFKSAVCALLCTVCLGAGAQTLRIATLPAADSIALDVAVDEGFFKKHGLDVETVPFKSALEVGAAMRAGRLAGHFGDLMNVFTQNETGAEQAVVLTTTHTSPEQRAFALVTAPKYADRLNSLADLKETPTAMSASTIIDYLLDRLQQTSGLSKSAFKNMEVRQIPIRLQMLLAGQIETALLPEPLVTVVEKKGGRVLWDDTKLDESLAVVALRKPYLDDKTVTAFRSAVAEAAARIEADPEKYRALMVQKRLIPAVVAKDYKMVRFSMFGTPDALPPLPTAEDVRRVAQWMLERGMIQKAPVFEEVVYVGK